MTNLDKTVKKDEQIKQIVKEGMFNILRDKLGHTKL